MQRLDSLTDEMNGVVTYEVAGGQRVKLDVRAVRERGAAALLRLAGIDPGEDGRRLPVLQDSREIGTLPANFDPMFSRSSSPFYDIRPTDFRRDGDRWLACRTICPGDFEAIPGFRWSRLTTTPA